MNIVGEGQTLNSLASTYIKEGSKGSDLLYTGIAQGVVLFIGNRHDPETILVPAFEFS